MKIVSGFRQSRIKSDEAGYVMVMAILVMVIATLIGVSLAVMGINEYSLSAGTKLMDAAYQIAEAGISRACVEMRDDPVIVTTTASTPGGNSRYKATGAVPFWRSGSSPNYEEAFGVPGWQGTFSASIWQSELMTNDPTYKVVVSTGKISKSGKTAERTIEARIIAGASTQDYDASFDYLIYNGYYGRPWAGEAKDDNATWPNATIWLGAFDFDGVTPYQGRSPKGAFYTRGSFKMPTGGLSYCGIHGNVVATNDVTLSNNFGISGLIIDNVDKNNNQVVGQGNVVGGLDGTGSATVSMGWVLNGLIKVSGFLAAANDFTVTSNWNVGTIRIGGLVVGGNISETSGIVASTMELGNVFCAGNLTVNNSIAAVNLTFKRISAGGNVSFSTSEGGDINVDAGTAPGNIYCGGKVTMYAYEWLIGSDITVDDIYAGNGNNEAVFINSDSSEISAGEINAQGSVKVDPGGTITINGDITAGKDSTSPDPVGLTLTNNNWSLTGTTGHKNLSSLGSMNVVVGSNTIENIKGGAAVTFNASGSGTVALDPSQSVTATGPINATVDGTDVGAMKSGAGIDLTATGSAASVGNITAVGAITATVSSADVGTMGSGGAVTLEATGSTASLGNITAVGNINAGQTDPVNAVTLGALRSGAAMNLTSSNSAIIGDLTAVGTINATVTGSTVGSLWSGGTTTLSDSGLNKTVGDISAGTNAAITVNIANSTSGGSIKLGRISVNGNLAFTGTRANGGLTNRIYIGKSDESKKGGIKTGGNASVTVAPNTDIYNLSPWDWGPGTPNEEYSRWVDPNWVDFDPVNDPLNVAVAVGGTYTTSGTGTITLYNSTGGTGQKRETLKKKEDHNQQWVPGVDTPAATSAPSAPSAVAAPNGPWYFGPSEGYPYGTGATEDPEHPHYNWFDHKAPEVNQRALLAIAELDSQVQLLEPNWEYFLDAATQDQVASGVPHVLQDGAAGDEDQARDGKIQFLWTSTKYSKNETIYQGDAGVPIEVTVYWGSAGSDFKGTLVTKGDVLITNSLGGGGWRVDTGQQMNIIAGRDIKKTSVESGFYWVTADNCYYHWWARGDIDFSSGAFALGTDKKFNGSFVAGNRFKYSDSYLWTISRWNWSRWDIDTNAWLPPFAVLSYREI